MNVCVCVRVYIYEEGMAAHSNILAWRIPMERGTWWATVHGVIKTWIPLSSSSYVCVCIYIYIYTYIYIYKTESLCYAPEINTINQLYSNKVN